MRRSLALLATLVLLWAVVTELNHALSGLHLYVFAGGLHVSYIALTQPMRAGLAVSFVSGLVCDAHAPVAFGTHALLFAAAFLTLFRIRDRIPREDNVASTLVALFTNFGLFLLFSFTQLHTSPAPASAWPRLIGDVICSQIFVALVTPWFFALQARTLAITDALASLRANRAR